MTAAIPSAYVQENLVSSRPEDGALLLDPAFINAWGIAMAPTDFGSLTGDLLVGNFGDGRILSLDIETLDFEGFLLAPDGTPVEIDGLWDLIVGNGASLGAADRLYFAAGPEDETEGLFGSLSFAGDAAQRLRGDGTDNALRGGTGADVTNGGKGADTAVGDAGDDLMVGSTGDDDLSGGVGNDTLRGADGADVLFGGLGGDRLRGGVGADRFRYLAPDEGGDRILDLLPGEDRIEISAAGFGGGLAAPGVLDAARFVLGITATEGFGQVIYDQGSRTLWWDGDGTGVEAAVVIATLVDAPALTATDIAVIA